MIYDIADLRIKINNKSPFTDRFCKDYLSIDQISPVDLEVQATQSEIDSERALCPKFSEGYLENICIYRKICEQMPKWDRFLLHAAVLEYKGDCYAFLGKSGTGKSTHTGLWLKNLPTARILNGDKPIIGYKDGRFTVYGTPWMGKERFGYNGKGVLKSLCFLEQAKVNEISLIEQTSVAERLFIQLLLPKDFDMVARTLELADFLVKTLPSYLMKCDISYQAFKTSFEKLTGERIDE